MATKEIQLQMELDRARREIKHLEDIIQCHVEWNTLHTEARVKQQAEIEHLKLEIERLKGDKR